jgi:hypothetical protein
MTRWMNGGGIERLAMVTNGESAQGRSDPPKSRPISTKAESGQSIGILIPEGWLDRIQVGFPRANWW